ncbi:MAG: hypothetical protein JOZ45_16890 [Acidobacteriaceae bacterium]|nr:hypothetical protein [Acidobacteriaceae bacterium]
MSVDLIVGFSWRAESVTSRKLPGQQIAPQVNQMPMRVGRKGAPQGRQGHGGPPERSGSVTSGPCGREHTDGPESTAIQKAQPPPVWEPLRCNGVESVGDGRSGLG